jgi:(2S)-methylsuccinyl-CoA dehydrogenase
MSSADLAAAAALVDCAETTIATGAEALRRAGGPDAAQVLAYDLAHAAAAATTARVMLDYGAKGGTEAAITCAFAADVVHDLLARVAGRQELWGSDLRAFDAVLPTLERYRDPEFVATLAETPGPLHLDDDMDMVRDTFRSFAANVVAPHAEHVHRTNGDVPEDVITGLAELGAFGLSVPAEYGG